MESISPIYGYPRRTAAWAGLPPCMAEWAVGGDPMSRRDAEEWIARHPLTNQSKFWREAEKLGPSSVPGMIEVLSDGPAELHAQAGLVLSRNGVKVFGGGDDLNPEWVLTLADGETLTVTPRQRMEPDSDYNLWGDPTPTLDTKAMRKLLLGYAAMFAIAAVLAVGAYATSGIVRLILAVLAGLIFAVALWSTVFMTVARIVQKAVQRFTNEQ